jgi:uncharacterized protein YbcI
MSDDGGHIAKELAVTASRFQGDRTGHTPKAVTAVLSDDTLVVTLHDALTPAEVTLAQSPTGALQVQEYHRRLFAASNDDMRREIKRLTGREVREEAVEIEITTGAVVHAFTTGAMVQVYLLLPSQVESEGAIAAAEDDGMRIPPCTD